MIRMVLVLGLFLAAGCNRGGSVPRIFGPLSRSASADLRCERIDQILYVSPRVVQVRGCGRRQEYVVDARRRPMHGIPRVETVAAHDLFCDGDALQVESPAPAVRIIEGCQRRARYDLRCGATDCRWTMTVHAGAWAGGDMSIPPQFAAHWELPPEAAQAPVTAPEGYVDLLTVDVPTPPPSTEPTEPTVPVIPPPP